jgi:hypothetical protein
MDRPSHFFRDFTAVFHGESDLQANQYEWPDDQRQGEL